MYSLFCVFNVGTLAFKPKTPNETRPLKSSEVKYRPDSVGNVKTS